MPMSTAARPNLPTTDAITAPRPGKLGRMVVAFGVAVVALVWAGIAWDYAKEREQALQIAAGDTANLARAFEEHILRTIGSLDQSLLMVKAEFERDPSHFDFARAAAGSALLQNVSRQIAVIDADGMLTHSTVPGASRIDLGDREHFKIHRETDRGQLFVSKPVLGRASQHWSIQLSRRLNHADGSFAGVAVISLDPGYLGEFYQSIDTGRDGLVLLAGRDGIVRAATAQPGDKLGQDLTGTPLATAFAGAAHGTLSVTGPLDPVSRLASFRALAGVPLVVVVGRSEPEVLAPVHDALLTNLLIGLALTAAVVAAVVMLLRLVRSQDETARRLEAKKQELFDSRERLRSYVADIERIAEMAAHDLKEPLRRVVAYAQLLAAHSQQSLDDEARGFLSHMIEGAHRLRLLVGELEDFVSVEHLPLSPGMVSSAAALGAACDRLDDALRDSGTQVLAEQLPEVAADQRCLVEVFTLLIDNAVRFRAQGRRPEVRVSAAEGTGGATIFSVRDNGVGMDSRQAGRAFEICHRPGLAADGDGGTGIGLALARRLIERLGGRIWVESEPGVGSVFRFSLPRAGSGAGEVELGQEARAAA